jgi:CheY-like chemotaxis protein
MAGNIVLVDDDPDDSFIFSEISKEVNQNHKITWLQDWKGLVEYLSTTIFPDVIFLDLNLPGVDGEECLKRLKEYPQWKNIPVVVYSTASTESTIERYYKLGATFYITKATSIHSLRNQLKLVYEKVVETYKS